MKKSDFPQFNLLNYSMKWFIEFKNCWCKNCLSDGLSDGLPDGLSDGLPFLRYFQRNYLPRQQDTAL